MCYLVSQMFVLPGQSPRVDFVSVWVFVYWFQMGDFFSEPGVPCSSNICFADVSSGCAIHTRLTSSRWVQWLDGNIVVGLNPDFCQTIEHCFPRWIHIFDLRSQPNWGLLEFPSCTCSSPLCWHLCRYNSVGSRVIVSDCGDLDVHFFLKVLIVKQLSGLPREPPVVYSFENRMHYPPDATQ